MGTYPTKGILVPILLKRQCKQVSFCRSIGRVVYRMEAQGPDHGYQLKMEQMGEQGRPVQHYHGPEHLLFGRVSHGTANGSRDADAGEV